MLEYVLTGLVKAGWVLLPLVAASLYGWLIAFHRLIVLLGLSWPGQGGWRQRVAQGRWEEYLNRPPRRDRGSAGVKILRDLHRARHGGREAMEAKLDEHMKFLVPELEKSLSTLAILASAAPLVGLLGTVAGMVKTFQVISAFGTGNQALMSDSIAEALMATQNGLLVAFPLMIMHVFLASRAEHIEKGVRAAGQAFINTLAPASVRP